MEFLLNAGQRIDPDSERVELIFSQGGTLPYDVTVAPGACAPKPSCFVQKGLDTCTKSWKFTDKEADVPGAFRSSPLLPRLCEESEQLSGRVDSETCALEIPVVRPDRDI